MKVILSLLFVCCFFPVKAHSESKGDDIHALIDVYRSGPLSERGYSAGQRILQFAEESDRVMIEINADKITWVADESIDPQLSPQMLLAYIVGSVDAQLKHGIEFDSYCSGITEVFNLVSAVREDLRKPAYSSALQSSKNGGCDSKT